MSRRVIEVIIRLSMIGLKLAVTWRMKRLGFSKVHGTHNWIAVRDKITPADPDVTVTVHEGTAVKDLVSAAVSSIFYKKSQP